MKASEYMKLYADYLVDAETLGIIQEIYNRDKE